MGKSFGDSARGAGKEARSSWGTASGGGSPKRGTRRGAPVKKDVWGKPVGKHAGKGGEKKSGWW